MKVYWIEYEQTEQGWKAFCPDLPGLVATGETIEEAQRRFHEVAEVPLQKRVAQKIMQEDQETLRRLAGKEATMITITCTTGSLAGTTIIRLLTTTPEERAEAERWILLADPEATKLGLGHWNVSMGAYESLCQQVERYNTEQADPAGQKLLW